MKKLIVIVGPTAIGKSSIGLSVAKEFNLEIISGDSVALYKRLDIGSAKPSRQELDDVKHHLIDICDPKEQYSVARFQKDVRNIIDNQDVGLIVGGTGLYINSVIFDYDFNASKLDHSLEDKYKDLTNEQLYEILLSKDKNIDESKIHPNNRKRVIRAIDVVENSNSSVYKTDAKSNMLYDTLVIYLNLEDREKLYERINLRVDEMMKLGLLEEVASLYNDGITPNAIGYKEFIDYFEGNIKIEEVVENIKQNSRRLAKRQITWFKNQLNAKVYNVNLGNINETKETIFNDIKSFLKE